MKKVYIILDRANDYLIQGTYSNKKKAYIGMLKYLKLNELNNPSIFTYDNKESKYIPFTYSNLLKRFKEYDSINLNYTEHYNISIQECIIK